MFQLARTALISLVSAGASCLSALSQTPPPAAPASPASRPATVLAVGTPATRVGNSSQSPNAPAVATVADRSAQIAASSKGDGERKKRSDKLATPLEIKIDDLEGDVTRCKNEWMLKIEYSVEIKSKSEIGNDPLVVLIELLERGHPVVTADGKPVQWLMPLDHPTKSKKNKREFERTMHTSLGETFGGDLEHLELSATVLNEATAVELAHKTEEVDFDDGHHGGIRGFGLSLFGFGGGLSW